MKSKVIYHGPSMIDGEEIIAVATFDSANTKTGENLIQTWILAVDVAPHVAQRDGRDVSVCGNCPLRPILAKGKRRPCYVKTFQAPRSVWAAFQRGSYGSVVPRSELSSIAAGRMVRLGSYGNPSAVPAHIWRELLRDAEGWTGYDHNWESEDALLRANSRAMRQWCMASAESVETAERARADGWRVFRVAAKGDSLLAGERRCPASKEAGALTTCDRCRACSGLAGRGHSSIVINAH